MKISLEDYKTATLEIGVDGVHGIVVIGPTMGRLWINAASKYQGALAYAKDNKISDSEKKIEYLGFEHKGKKVERETVVLSEFHSNAQSLLVSSLVVDWPFDVSLIDSLKESSELSDHIYHEAEKLTKEFISKKKT